jgi:3-dehydroquinate synthetase
MDSLQAKNVIGIYFQPTIGIYDSNTINTIEKIETTLISFIHGF